MCLGTYIFWDLRDERVGMSARLGPLELDDVARPATPPLGLAPPRGCCITMPPSFASYFVVIHTPDTDGTHKRIGFAIYVVPTAEERAQMTVRNGLQSRLMNMSVLAFALRPVLQCNAEKRPASNRTSSPAVVETCAPASTVFTVVCLL